MNGITFWLIYFAPTIVAWIRKKQGKSFITTYGSVVFINALLGWTIIGWFIALANAFGKNPVAWVIFRFANLFGGNQTGGGAPAAQSTFNASSQPVVCSQCQGSGSIKCSICGGRGSWYEAPTTESGTAQLKSCTACSSSGHLQCAYCGGSGHGYLRL